MNKSLFRKIFKTIGITSIISLIITILFCSLVIRRYVLNIEVRSIYKQVENTISQYDSGNNKLGERLKLILDKGVIIKGYDENGKYAFKYYSVDNLKVKVDYEKVNKCLNEYARVVLTGENIKGINTIEGISGDCIIIGIPRIENNEVAGAIMVMKPVKEFDNILNGFYIVLAFCLIFVIVFISIAIYISTKTLFKPLNDMTKATINMAKGDFSTRIEETQDDEVGELARAFNYLSYKLEQNDRDVKLLEEMRKNYVANVSHELKTPITSIRAIAELLNDEEIEDSLDKKKYYSMILRESVRLQGLIKDILELSSLQSEKSTPEKKKISLYDLMEEIKSEFEVIASDLDIEFKVYNENIKDTVVFTDYNRILQVMIILLDNAFKFTEEEGIVSVEIEKKEKFVNVIVSDTGIGIAEEDLLFVFDRFYKSDKSRKSTGTGLGLAIAAEIMTNLNERVYVDSKYGVGSKFSFTIHYE